MRPGLLVAVLSVLCSTPLPPLVAADAPLPYRLSVSVDWAAPVGPESIRDALEAELVLELKRAACFESVGRSGLPEACGPSLSLLLVLHDYREQTDFDHTVNRGGAADLETSRGSLAQVEAHLQAEVRLLPRGTPLRERRFKHRASWRPLWQEDAREAAQRDFVENVARTVRKFACKGSAGKWANEIERAELTSRSGTR